MYLCETGGGIIIKRIIVLIIVILLFTSCRSAEQGVIQIEYYSISMEEAINMMREEKDYIILDVRMQDEYDTGHIPGAILLINETIHRDTVANVLPDKGQLIFVYCRSGNRSKQAAKKLANLGYDKIYEFGGIIDWPYETEKE